MEDLQGNESSVLPAYIPQFDGLRGIAILAVFLAHSEFIQALPHAHALQYGRIGVDLFFVLSGFLITGILLDSKGSANYFRNFYMRRALRIWPLYYLILAISYFVFTAGAPRNEGGGIARMAVPYLLRSKSSFTSECSSRACADMVTGCGRAVLRELAPLGFLIEPSLAPLDAALGNWIFAPAARNSVRT